MTSLNLRGRGVELRVHGKSHIWAFCAGVFFGAVIIARR